MKKHIALILILSLALLCLAGCSKSEIQSYTDEELAAAETPAEDSAAEGEIVEEAVVSTADAANAFAADTVVCTINGLDITWDEYFYWLNNYRLSVENSFGTIEDWSAMNAYYTQNSNDEVVRVLAQGDMLYYNMILAEAAARGTGVEPDAVESQVLSDIDLALGDGDGTVSQEEDDLFNTYISEQGMTRDLYTRITRQLLTEQALYEDSSADVTEEQVMAWSAEQGYMNAKHILLLTVDSITQEALTEDEVAAAKATAEDIYAQLSEAYDPAAEDNSAFLALFDQLMNEYSEDTGLISNPNGYVFLPGQMVTAFEEGVLALDENYAMSGVVESEYGYHIILRQPIAADTVLGQNAYGVDVTLTTAACSDLFNTELQELSTVAEIQWAEGFENLSMAELFG